MSDTTVTDAATGTGQQTGQPAGQAGDQNAGAGGDQTTTGQQAGGSSTGQAAQQQPGATTTTQTGTPAGADSTATGAKQQGTSGEGDLTQLPAWGQKIIGDLRKEAASARTSAKQTAAQEARDKMAQEIGKALGLIKDEDEQTDPAKLTQQLATERGKAKDALVESAVLRAAISGRADPDKFVDSRSFMAQVAKLDPADDGFKAAVNDLVKQAIEANPTKYQTGGQAPPARSGGEFTGGPGEHPDPDSFSVEEHRAARRKDRGIGGAP